MGGRGSGSNMGGGGGGAAKNALPNDVRSITYHGTQIDSTVASSVSGGVSAARTAPFQQVQNTDYNYNPDRDSPSMMRHYDEEVVSVTVNGRTANGEVGHSVLGDGTEVYAVSMNSSTANGIGATYTRGRSHTRSGYLYPSRTAARAAARKAVQWQLRHGN